LGFATAAIGPIVYLLLELTQGPPHAPLANNLGHTTFNPTAPRFHSVHAIDPGGLSAVARPSTRFCVAVDHDGNAVDGDPGAASARLRGL
jgi:hypothetical protein